MHLGGISPFFVYGHSMNNSVLFCLNFVRQYSYSLLDLDALYCRCITFTELDVKGQEEFA